MILKIQDFKDFVFRFENQLGGGFVPHILSSEEIGVRTVAVLDFQGDSHLDILSGGHDNVALFENLGNGDFDRQYILMDGFGMVVDVIAEDFSVPNDGLIDCIVLDWEDSEYSPSDQFIDWNSVYHSVVFFENRGNGAFLPEEIWDLGGDRVRAFDSNADGTLDLVLSVAEPVYRLLWWDYELPPLMIFENVNATFFQTTEIPANVTGIVLFEVGDFDSDGDPDLLYQAVDSMHELVWMENLGENQWAHHFISENFTVRDIHLVDFDSDAALDVLAVGEDGTVVWFRNLGDSFKSYQFGSGFSEFDFITTGSFDGDDALDVVVSSRSLNWIVSLTNPG